MTERRHAHTYAQPARTGGDDETAPPPCYAYEQERVARNAETPRDEREVSPYDILIDYDRTHYEHRIAYRKALRVARDICHACPIALECLKANRNERWAGAVWDYDHRRPPKKRDTCGKPHGAKFHSINGERACDACLRAGAAEKARQKERKRNQKTAERARKKGVA